MPESPTWEWGEEGRRGGHNRGGFHGFDLQA